MQQLCNKNVPYECQVLHCSGRRQFWVPALTFLKRDFFFLKKPTEFSECRDNESFVKHINPFCKNAQRIIIPGGISHGANKSKSFNEFVNAQVHRGQAREPRGQGVHRNKLEGCAHYSGQPLLRSLLQGCEPAFPDLSVFQEKQEIWTCIRNLPTFKCW